MGNMSKIWTFDKWWLSLDEISGLLGLSTESSRVFCSRAVKRGELVRVKRGIYTVKNASKKSVAEERFKLANILQSPSYVSLLTALSFHNATTQVVVSTCESISLERTASFEDDGFVYRFVRFPKKYMKGFKRTGGFFMATKEKALADAVYLCSLGRYSLDFTAIDFNSIDKKKFKEMLRLFPARTREYFETRVCK